jgi:hypothetical protein
VSLDREPTRLAAGDTWTWSRTLPDYPAADGWLLRYYARPSVGTGLETEAAEVTVDGDTWTVSVPSSRTGVLTAGTFRLAGYVSRGTDRHEVYAGVLRVTPNFASGDATAALSTDEQLLDVLSAAVAGRLSSDIAETYTIDGVAVAKIPARDLARMLAEVRSRLRRRRTGKLTQTVKVRYGR